MSNEAGEQEKRIADIRKWRDAYRPFHALPENISAFEHREERMVQHIDYLLSLLDSRPIAQDGARERPERCADCDECAKYAYSDGTTAGFFYSKCEKHRAPSRHGGDEKGQSK